VVRVVVAWFGLKRAIFKISRRLVANYSQPASCLRRHRHTYNDRHALKSCLIAEMPARCGVVLSVLHDSWLILLALIHSNWSYY